MKKLTIITSGLLLMSSYCMAQMPAEKSFKKTKSGLAYAFVNDNKKTPNAKVGDYVEMHISYTVADSMMFDSKVVNQGKAVVFQIAKPAFNGDLSEGFILMSAGDKAYLKVSVDSLLKASGVQKVEWMKTGVGQTLDYFVDLISVKTQAEVESEKAAKATEQKAAEEKAFQEYFKTKNLKPLKTASGLYYVIKKKGTTPLVKATDQVSVNYTGYLLDGNVFDSNVDSNFKHVEPFNFTVGQGNVIKGWDEGLTLVGKGGELTLYIPSALAYGERGAGGLIQPYTPLAFDIEVLNVTSKPAASSEPGHEGHNH